MVGKISVKFASGIRRVMRLRSKNTMCRTVPKMPRTSTLKKSQANSVFQWFLRGCFQVRLQLRSSAGSIPASASMFATVVRVRLLIVLQAEVAIWPYLHDWLQDVVGHAGV